MESDAQPTGPILSTARVRLRPFRPEDAGHVAASCQDPEIPRFTMMPDSLTEQEARRWIERRNQLQDRGLFALAITVDQTDTCVGQMGVFVDWQNHRAETFYWIDRDQRGRGITSEALTLITNWAFAKHDIIRAQLINHPDNQASQRVAVRSGYQREGLLRSWEPVKNSQPDVVMWSRLRSDPLPTPSPL